MSETEKRISDLFGYVCKHCGDPRAVHVRPSPSTPHYGPCFISDCKCEKFELDNLKFLEQVDVAND